MAALALPLFVSACYSREEALQDIAAQDASLRVKAAERLGGEGDQEAVNALKGIIFNDQEDTVVIAAIRSLGESGENVPFLKEYISCSLTIDRESEPATVFCAEEYNRGIAVEIISAKNGENEVEYFRQLFETDGSGFVLEAAAEALAQHDTDAQNFLTRQLTEGKNINCQVGAAAGLGKLNTAEADAALLLQAQAISNRYTSSSANSTDRKITANDKNLLSTTLYAMSKNDSRDSVGGLTNLYKQAADQAVRKDIIYALGEKKGELAKHFLIGLLNTRSGTGMSADEILEIRVAAVEELSGFNDYDVRQAFLFVLRNDQEDLAVKRAISERQSTF